MTNLTLQANLPFDLDNVTNNMEAVVDNSILDDVPQVEVTVCKITDKKHTSRLIQELNKKLPIPTLQHLKRVSKEEIILQLSSKFDTVVFPKLNIDTTGIDLKSLRKLEVPSEIPKTRKQYGKACAVWPCAYREDKYLESLLSNSLFSKTELEEHCRWMREAIIAAERSKTSVGAVVVNPQLKIMLAVSSDDRTSHPMKHAIMVAVDLIARTQGGGVWPVKENDYVFKQNVRKTSVTHSKRDLEGVEKPVGPYLCTGYDLYVTREPCTMCAMAMVHSRVRRVFYGCSSNSGALGTLVKLHSLKGLNHHYEVFKNLLNEHCYSLNKN